MQPMDEMTYFQTNVELRTRILKKLEAHAREILTHMQTEPLGSPMHAHWCSKLQGLLLARDVIYKELL